MPVFFLYFSEILSLQQVLLLESVYYISVVVLEVPTGYFSDVIGRRITLLLGALFLCLASIFYFIGGSFFILLIGQIFFGLHMSFLSGTNTVFHYESLNVQSREQEYGDREAKANKYGMIAGGTAALLGGALASVDLRLAYVASFIAGTIGVAIAFQFTEPEHQKSEASALENMFSQVVLTGKYLRYKPLAWISAYYIVIYLVTHVPYEFYQPYVSLLEEEDLLLGTSAPIVAGVLYAFARYFGAFGAAYSMVWKRKVGLKVHLFLMLLIINLIVLAMGLLLHPLLIMIFLMRSLPWAAIKAPVNEIITPAIGRGQRATFHSMLSLACRFFFFLMLIGMALIIPGGEEANWENLSLLLRVCFLIGMILSVLLWATSSNIKTVKSE